MRHTRLNRLRSAAGRGVPEGGGVYCLLYVIHMISVRVNAIKNPGARDVGMCLISADILPLSRLGRAAKFPDASFADWAREKGA